MIIFASLGVDFYFEPKFKVFISKIIFSQLECRVEKRTL